MLDSDLDNGSVTFMHETFSLIAVNIYLWDVARSRSQECAME